MAVTVVAAIAVTVMLARMAFLELFLSGLADGDDLTGEVQGLAGHRVVEIHSDRIVSHFMDDAVDNLAGIAHHGNHPSYDK